MLRGNGPTLYQERFQARSEELRWRLQYFHGSPERVAGTISCVVHDVSHSVFSGVRSC
jgi:hypothetical protein